MVTGVLVVSYRVRVPHWSAAVFVVIGFCVVATPLSAMNRTPDPLTVEMSPTDRTNVPDLSSIAPAPSPQTRDQQPVPQYPDNVSDDMVVRGRRVVNPADPLEVFNAKSFAITQKVDDAVIAPAATGYEKTVPTPIRNGLRNALANLQEPIIIINYFLQHNIAKTGETIGRFAINSTIGLAGLFDIARRKPFHLPFRHNGFADTFGFYGVKPGAYLFLPLIGATTVRDLVGDNLDRLVLPIILGSPFNRSYFAIPAGIERTLDHRIAFDEELQEMRKTRDPYAARRDFYLLGRQREIDGLHEKRRVRLAPPAPGAPQPTIH